MQLRFYFIYITVFVNVMAFTMVFPLLPLYAQEFHASTFQIGALAGSFGLAQLLFSPLWGLISDRIGRRPTILFGTSGLALGFVLFGAADGLGMLFMARFLQGAFVGATLPSARAYVADLSDKAHRVRAMGRVGASLALGVIMGPFIGGVLAEGGLSLPGGISFEPSLSLPFFVSAVVAVLNFILVAAFLPESLTKKSERIALRESFINIPKLAQQFRGTLAPFLLLGFLWSFGLSNNQVSIPLLGDKMFNATPGEMGILFGLMGIVSFITQLFLLTYIARRWGERRAAIAGISLMALSFAIMPFMPFFGALALTAMFAAFGSSTSRPLITALASEETTEGQGATMGILTSMEALGRMLGPFLGGMLFGLWMPAPFLFSAAVIAAALVFVVFRLHFFRRAHHHAIA